MNASSSNQEKVEFFRRLFLGREDVFARRFDNAKTGKKGYSPVCENQWKAGICGLAKGVKCSTCEHRRFVPYSDEVVRWHLRGVDAQRKPFEIGVYPMLSDETARFAAIDFDKSSWRRDALLVMRQFRKLDIPVALEKSRSGKGAHIWLFLSEPQPVKAIRELMTFILTLTLEKHSEIGLDSYDRIIPNQDTMPKGGFGSLIALPLQRAARTIDNSVFVNDDWVPYPDQWAFLASLNRLDNTSFNILLHRARSENRTLLPTSADSSNPSQPWSFFLPLWGAPAPSLPHEDAPTTPINLVLANRIYIEQQPLNAETRSQIIAQASFVNPEFRTAERMKFSVYGKPRIISRALNGESFLEVPRGCLENVLRILKDNHYKASVVDKRYGGIPIDVTFHGDLRAEQKPAAAALDGSDTGILAAGTAFGKTVLAAWMIARRKTNTLVLVHRRPLQMQWVARLAMFLGIDEKKIGRIGGGAQNWTGKIDVAIMQSLFRKGVIDPRVKEYGQIVIDECHGIAAETFEAIVDTAPCRYVLGLSATVMRKDGHHPLIMMQCGPIRYRVDPKTQSGHEPFDHVVNVRPTAFRLPTLATQDNGEVAYADMIRLMVADEARNRMIAADILSAVKEGRSPVVLSERREHLEIFRQMLEGEVAHVILLRGGMGQRESRELRNRMAAIPATESRVIPATGSYLGEGFDDSRLDTLFLTLPISWKGRLTQYAGRLHRLHDGKHEVRICDYLDVHVAVCNKMFERRARGYEAIGYKMFKPVGLDEGWPMEVPLPVVPHWKETFTDSIRRLCRDGVTEALANLFVYATLQMELGEQALARPTAHAAVVAFLRERLDTLPSWKGKFSGDVRLPVQAGGNPFIEVDLLSANDKIAIMLDEIKDISDVERYRLARQEDRVLQRNGYKVVRLLIEDVCTNLSFVLAVIHDATH